MPAKKLIHFIGIGGIGVSAIAKYHLEKGHIVSGSDLVSSEITEDLEKKGAKIFIGKHDAKNLPDNADVVVYSPAVKKDNLELKKANELKIKTLSYPQVLGILTKNHFTVAISGTHGKSTTTSMLGLILVKAGFDPTVVVGTKLKEFGDSNFRMGKSQYLVIEACEHEESFLNYWPKIAIVTNIEEDHLDYYKNLKNIIKAFKKFVGHLPKDGLLIINNDNKNSSGVSSEGKKLGLKIQGFSLKQKEAVALRKLLKIPGEHNVSDALAALAAARELGIPDKVSFESLSRYQGSWRRFEERELKLKNYKLKVINDYGHHPTALKATVESAREKYPKKKIWLVFQPHQYQRTFYLFKDFVAAIRECAKKSFADKIIIADIYDVAGRESNAIRKKVSSEKLVKAVRMKNVIYLPKEKIIPFVKENISQVEVLMIMGAGDIYSLDSCLTE
jgi:UDP-N-acetylmuramate--alanine ligase